MKPRRSRAASLTAALLLVLSLVGLGGQALAASPATITIHKLICPSDTSGDLFTACHKHRLAYVAFDIKGQNVVTDEQGEVSVEVMYGKVPITEDGNVFYAYTGAYVYCSEQSSGTVLFNDAISNPLVTVQTSPGAEVVCDWYNFYDPATQTVDFRIVKNTCPLNAISVSDCIKYGTANVKFTVNGAAVKTDVTATAYLDLAPGPVTVKEDPATLAKYAGGTFVRCWTGDGEVLLNRVVKKGGFTVTAKPGSLTVCNVTNLPKVLPTPVSIIIHKASCPANTSGDIFAACHDNRLAGIDFTVNGHPTTTADNGVTTYWLDPGTITVKEDTATFNGYAGAYVYCAVPGSSSALYEGKIATNAISFKANGGQIVICDWYDLT